MSDKSTCKICGHHFKIGENWFRHAYDEHPQVFINALLTSPIAKHLVTQVMETILEE